MSYDGLIKCRDCDRTVKSHRWAVTKAGGQGWFFQKDGTAYCPDHTPDWLTAWRAKRSK